jgi:hypothetical protein
MVRPRIFKRSHVDDPKLNKVLQDIDDEFSNLYAGLTLATGPTGASVTGPTGAVATGPSGASVTGPTGAAITGPTGAPSLITGPTGSASTVTGPTGPGGIGPTGPGGEGIRTIVSNISDDPSSWLNGADESSCVTWVVPVNTQKTNWIGHEGEYATYQWGAWPETWVFETPGLKDEAYSIQTQVVLFYNGSWHQLYPATEVNGWNIDYDYDYEAFVASQ